MKLVNVEPKSLVGRTVSDHLGSWWLVKGFDETHLHLEKPSSREKGKLAMRMLPRCRLYPDQEEIERRFPLLLRALRWGALLTPGKAIGAILGQSIQGNFSMSSEAVAHIGGSAAAIRQACRCRHVTRDLYARNRGREP